VAHWIAYPTKAGAGDPKKLKAEVLGMLDAAIWGVPSTAMMASKLLPGDGLLILVGAPYYRFVGDAVIGSVYRPFADDELARLPAGLSFDHGVSLRNVRIWSPTLHIADAIPHTEGLKDSNPKGKFFGAITPVSSVDAAAIIAEGTCPKAAQHGSTGAASPAASAVPVEDTVPGADEAGNGAAAERSMSNSAGLLVRLLRAAKQSPPWLPDRIAHADWGTDPAKRVVTSAKLVDGAYQVGAPRTVGASGGLIERMGLTGPTGVTTLLGFDFPIGVPRAYAERVGFDDFAAWFRQLDISASFFEAATSLDDVSPSQPFFPHKPPTTKAPGLKALFVERLGIPAACLLRDCDRAHCDRRAASEMFWAIGAAAVAKATLAGLEDTLRPAFAEAHRTYRLWPFEGQLAQLLSTSDAVIVETYPTEAYRQLGLQMGTSSRAKTRQEDRRAEAFRLLDWCADNAVVADDELAKQIHDGFGPTSSGEDPFDSVAGLFGMIDTVRRAREPDLPDDPVVRRIEGWMFGQHAVCPQPNADPGGS
jgi:hypothetical protein